MADTLESLHHLNVDMFVVVDVFHLHIHLCRNFGLDVSHCGIDLYKTNFHLVASSGDESVSTIGDAGILSIQHFAVDRAVAAASPVHEFVVFYHKAVMEQAGRCRGFDELSSGWYSAQS